MIDDQRYKLEDEHLEKLRQKILKPTWFERFYGVIELYRIKALHELEGVEDYRREHRDQNRYDVWLSSREYTEDSIFGWKQCRGGRAYPAKMLKPFKLSNQTMGCPTMEAEHTDFQMPSYKNEVPFWFQYFLETGTIIDERV
jgi:hypothetical protein